MTKLHADTFKYCYLKERVDGINMGYAAKLIDNFEPDEQLRVECPILRVVQSPKVERAFTGAPVCMGFWFVLSWNDCKICHRQVTDATIPS